MRRVLQRLSLFGLLAAVFPPAHAFGATPEDTRQPTDEKDEELVPPRAAKSSEAEQPGASAPAAALSEPAVASAPAVQPKVGDLSISGYLRGGFGASNQKGRMTCFALAIPGGLVSK